MLDTAVLSWKMYSAGLPSKGRLVNEMNEDESESVNGFKL